MTTSDVSPTIASPCKFVVRSSIRQSGTAWHYWLPFFLIGILPVIVKNGLSWWNQSCYQTQPNDYNERENWLRTILFLGTCDDDNSSRFAWITTLFLGMVLLLASWLFNGKDSSSEVEHVVSIYPLGVQLSTWSYQQQRGTITRRRVNVTKPRWIPRDDILDVMVTEVILSYKVVSILSFRTRRQRRRGQQASLQDCPAAESEPTYSASSTIEDWTLNQRKSHVQIIPAFPSSMIDNLTYQQCLILRDRISHALGLPR